MVIRVFRARTKARPSPKLRVSPKRSPSPFVDRQPGLVARHTGKGIGASGEELIMISVWESLEAMNNRIGEEWESAVMPDHRIEQLIEETFLHQY